MKNKTAVARRGQRGVVLITVLLVLLVLSVLGMTAAIMMTQEDRSSSRAELQREAFYVAESGLRRAEGIATAINYDNVVLSNMLARTTSTACPATNPQVPVVPTVSPADWGVGHLGTYLTTAGSSPVELSNQDVTSTLHLSGKVRAFYSLYVRNNEGEVSATINTDTKIRLVSVGWVADSLNNPLAVKILEEEIDFSKLSMNVSTQKQVDFGGTGSGVFGG
jgi:hypothetical protein